MATEELIVLLDAQTQKLDAKLRKTESRLDILDGTVKKTDNSLKSFSKSMRGAGGAAVALIAALGIRQFTSYADQIQAAENQLKSVTSSTEEFTAVQEELRRISGETRQSLSELTSVYARFKRAGEEAGFTIQETLDLTEQLTKAFKIEGNTTAEVNSVLLQLTQSFRSGVIAGEEFRALSEGSTIALRALASQLGVTTGDLKKMAADGLITPKDLIAGLEGAQEEINSQFSELEPTFAEVGTAMGRVFTAAYDDSIAESTSSKLKAILIATGADIERFFTGDETLSESGLENRINELSAKVLKMKQEFNGLTDEQQAFSFLAERIQIARVELDGYQERLSSMQDSDPLEMLITDGEEDPRIQQERDFAAAVLEIHTEQAETMEGQLQREVEIHRLALESKLINEQDFQKAMEDSAKKFGKSSLKESGKLAKAEQSLQSKNIQSIMAISSGILGHSSAIGKALFLGSQALAASQTFVNTQAASIKALTIDPTGGLSAKVQLSGNLALAAIAATTIGSVAGGGGSGSLGGGDSSAPDSSLELSDQSTEGDRRLVIELATDTGDDLVDAFAAAINKGVQQGRFG